VAFVAGGFVHVPGQGVGRGPARRRRGRRVARGRSLATARREVSLQEVSAGRHAGAHRSRRGRRFAQAWRAGLAASGASGRAFLPVRQECRGRCPECGEGGRGRGLGLDGDRRARRERGARAAAGARMALVALRVVLRTAGVGMSWCRRRMRAMVHRGEQELPASRIAMRGRAGHRRRGCVPKRKQRGDEYQQPDAEKFQGGVVLRRLDIPASSQRILKVPTVTRSSGKPRRVTTFSRGRGRLLSRAGASRRMAAAGRRWRRTSRPET